MLAEIGCWYMDWNAIGTWVGAIGSVAAGAAAFWAWRTAKSSYELSKTLSDRAQAEAFENELERLSLQATTVEVEATKLQTLARNVRSRATSKAMESGALGGSRSRVFVERVDGVMAEATQALDDVKPYRESLSQRCGGSIDEVRQARTRLTEMAALLRGRSESLEIDSKGWV